MLYRVRAQVIVILTETAEALDRQDRLGDNKILIRQLKSVSSALLLCELLLCPTVLAADVWPHTNIIRVYVPAARPHCGGAWHIVAGLQAWTIIECWTACG